MVAALRGEPYKVFISLRADWARPLLLWAARHYTGMTLQEIGMVAGGMDYTAVAMAIKRFEQKATKDAGLKKKMKQITKRMCNVKT